LLRFECAARAAESAGAFRYDVHVIIPLMDAVSLATNPHQLFDTRRIRKPKKAVTPGQADTSSPGWATLAIQALSGTPTVVAAGRTVVGMDNRNEIREFLASRRAKLTPEQAGLPDFGGVRRVPGLRREEVSLLAGMSVEYYTRVERGSLAGVSDSVLEAIARALKLNEAEGCAHHRRRIQRHPGPVHARRVPAGPPTKKETKPCTHVLSAKA
jgi:transcriptional regulator with XRE-family HTH domain